MQVAQNLPSREAVAEPGLGRAHRGRPERGEPSSRLDPCAPVHAKASTVPRHWWTLCNAGRADSSDNHARDGHIADRAARRKRSGGREARSWLDSNLPNPDVDSKLPLPDSPRRRRRRLELGAVSRPAVRRLSFVLPGSSLSVASRCPRTFNRALYCYLPRSRTANLAFRVSHSGTTTVPDRDPRADREVPRAYFKVLSCW